MVHGFVKAPAWEPADPGLKATKESLVGKGTQADKGHLKRSLLSQPLQKMQSP